MSIGPLPIRRKEEKHTKRRIFKNITRVETDILDILPWYFIFRW